MMLKLISIAIVILLGVSRLIHLMGFVAFSMLWLLAALGFVAAGVAKLASSQSSMSLLVIVTGLLLLLTGLDRGIVDLVIIALLLINLLFARKMAQASI